MSSRIGLWLCRRGFHSLLEPGNCMRCGFRGHGGHVGHYAGWVASGLPVVSKKPEWERRPRWLWKLIWRYRDWREHG